LGETIRNYYAEELTTANQHRLSTIKGVKAIFKCWIFRDTYEQDILNSLVRVEDIQYKKFSSITPKMIKELHQICSSRSPYVVNRLVEYLRLFWNSFIKEENNPFKLPKRNKFEEEEYLDFLDQSEPQRECFHTLLNVPILNNTKGSIKSSNNQKIIIIERNC